VTSVRSGAMAAVASALLAVAPAARAQHDAAELPPRVVLRLPECDATPIDFTEAVRLLRIELSGDGVEEVDVVDDSQRVAPGTAAAGIVLELSPCEPPATTVDVTIDDAVTSKRVRRLLDLSRTVDDARARAVSVAVAELLRASWAELARPEHEMGTDTEPEGAMRTITVTPDEIGAVVDAPPEEAERHAPRASVDPEPAPERGVDFSASAGPAVRIFLEDESVVIGGTVGAWVLLGPSLAAGLGLAIGVGSVDVQATDDGGMDPILRAGIVDLGLAALSASVLVGSDRDQTVSVAVGPRLDVGYGWASGDSNELVVRDGGGSLVLLASAQARALARLGGAWSAALGVDLGYALAGLDAGVAGETPTGLGGPTLAIDIGLALQL